MLLSIAEKNTAKEAWEALKMMCQEDERVKKANVQTLRTDFESLSMKDNEQLDEIYLRLNGLVSNIRVLGDEMKESYVKEEVNIAKLDDDEPTLLLAKCDTEGSGATYLSEKQLMPSQMTKPQGESNVWYLDNGTSSHMMGFRSKFTKLDEKVTSVVRFGDGSSVRIEGKWNNIISPGQLTEEGNRVIIKGEFLWVYDYEDTLLMKMPLITSPDEVCRGCLMSKQTRKHLESKLCSEEGATAREEEEVRNDCGEADTNVKTAFLNGDIIEDVYIAQLEGYEKKGKKDLVYKLLKALYGLRQAPRAWNSGNNLLSAFTESDIEGNLDDRRSIGAVVGTFESTERAGKNTVGRPSASTQVQDQDHPQAQDPGADRDTLQEQPLTHTPVMDRVITPRDARNLTELN
ncbi:hypothetical protein AgCh_024438 [Apium graveolens]